MALYIDSTIVSLVAFLTADLHAVDRGNFDVSTFAPSTASEPVSGGLAVAYAPGRGVPSLMWVPRGDAPAAALSPDAAARAQLERHAGTYGVTPAVIAGARTVHVHDTGRGGIIVVLRQTVAGVDVFHGDVKLLLDRSLRLLAISGAPHPDAHAGAAQPFARDLEASIAAALRDLHGVDGRASLVEVDAAAGWRRFALAGESRLRFLAPARARPVYMPVGEQLVPAFLVELQTRLGAREDVYQYVVAADDGRLLMRRDATARATHQYRVYAETDGLRWPLDSPRSDFNPHPTGVPGDGPADFAAAALVSVDGLNDNPEGLSDPWLPPGAAATVGNNADVHLDRLDVDPVEGERIRTPVSGPGVFDYTYDVSAPATANDEQFMAAMTHAFYSVNWLHDWWYDSGFVEAVGAAQFDNYGRGGAAGVPVLVRTQFGVSVGQRNNASISTPLDGASPRMQLYVYGEANQVLDLSAQPLDQQFAAAMAAFGPQGFDVTAQLVLVDDGAGVSPTDGCEAPTNDVQDKIVLVDRGECAFELKVSLAEAAGAVGVLVADNVEAATPIGLGDDVNVDGVQLPSLGIRRVAGVSLKDALAIEPQTVHMAAVEAVTRDSGLDTLLIAHEFGHLVHHRLVDHGTQQGAAMGEAWGDFMAQLLSARPGDDLDGAFVSVFWGSRDPTHYFGHRRFPFSTDEQYNALTFRHIGDGAVLPNSHPIQPNGAPNSEQHNAGEVWVEMMWESYVALQRSHEGELEFAEVQRLMSDYVIAAMMLAPVDPTYTEQRDALLMAIAATSEADMLVVAEAFAGRGAGSCAASPPRYSTGLQGVVEDYEARGRGVILGATIDDGLASCDQDGLVDAGELGRIAVAVWNGGIAPLPAGATLEVVDPPAGLVFPDGPSVALPELAALQQRDVTIAFTLADDFVGPAPAKLRLRLTTPSGCDAPAELPAFAQLDADSESSGATLDEVEVASVWTPTGDHADLVWSRRLGLDSRLWHGANVSDQSDTALVSPPFTAADDQDLVISFDHAYSFDYYWNNPWDGGVIELSEDDGATWEDVAEYGVETTYNGTINAEGNALVLRPAFVGRSGGHPALQPVNLDFGAQLAGKTLRLRFRIATNIVKNAEGWSIDNIRFDGITGAPFSRLVADAAECDPVEPTTGEDPTTGGEPTTGEAPTTGANEPTTTGVSTSDDTDSDGPDSAGSDAEAGCGCRTEASSDPWFGQLLALALLAPRRRRRAAEV